MKFILWNVIAALSMGFYISNKAYAADEYSLEDTDITPVVKYYSTQIVTLKKSVTIFNWSHHGASPYWSKEPKQGEPSLIKMVKNETHSFWDNFGSQKGTNNNYGFGLYGAVDPVLTYSYGGGDGGEERPADWMLTELRLPIGFKMIDLGSPNLYYVDVNVPQNVRDILEKFECHSARVQEYFLWGGMAVNAHCRELVKEIFNHDLKMDGFAYTYGATEFKECTATQTTDPMAAIRAFVITDSGWITPKNVKVYTSLSRADLDERVRIETLFLKSETDANGVIPMPSSQAVSDKIAQYLYYRPDSFLSSQTTNCGRGYCLITLEFCDPNNQCGRFSLDPFPQRGGGLITQVEASGGNYSQKLLWPDLEGKPKAEDITVWLKNNKYACTGDLPYDLPPAPAPQPTPAAQ